MTARLRYPELAPEGYATLAGFGHYVNTGTALEPVLLGLVYLRASALNGCTFCTELHKAELRKHNEPDTRIDAVLVAPDTDVFTPRERAALRWTAVITNLQEGHAPDSEYEAVSSFFHGKDLVDLTFAIANINAWNRMGVAFRPEWRPRHKPASPPGPNYGEEVAPSAPPAVAQPAPAPPQNNETRSAVDDDGGKAVTE